MSLKVINDSYTCIVLTSLTLELTLFVGPAQDRALAGTSGSVSSPKLATTELSPSSSHHTVPTPSSSYSISTTTSIISSKPLHIQMKSAKVQTLGALEMSNLYTCAVLLNDRLRYVL